MSQGTVVLLFCGRGSRFSFSSLGFTPVLLRKVAFLQLVVCFSVIVVDINLEMTSMISAGDFGHI